MDIGIVQLLGHVENMESMKMAMQREAKEEFPFLYTEEYEAEYR